MFVAPAESADLVAASSDHAETGSHKGRFVCRPRDARTVLRRAGRAEARLKTLEHRIQAVKLGR